MYYFLIKYKNFLERLEKQPYKYLLLNDKLVKINIINNFYILLIMLIFIYYILYIFRK